MNLAPLLEKAEFLCSPSFNFPNSDKSVLIHYGPNGLKIAKTVVHALSDKESTSKIQVQFFDWILQACGFALRINDQSSSSSYFQKALLLYLEWVDAIPFNCTKEIEEKYIQTMMVHLTQIFLNPSFDKENCYNFLHKIQSTFRESKHQFSETTWSVILKVLFYGIIEFYRFSSKVDSTEDIHRVFIRIALDCLYECKVDPSSHQFWNQFDDQLTELFKLNGFRNGWIDCFSHYYLTFLNNHSKSANNKYLSHFVMIFKSKIDTVFDENDKQKAFYQVINAWTYYTNSNTSLLNKKWCTQEITSMFLSWFSINYEWKHEDTMTSTHPIFYLIEMGEKVDDSNNLYSIASTIILTSLKNPKRTDSYWFFPQYSYNYLVNHPNMLSEIQDDFYAYVKEMRQSKYSNNVELNIHTLLILMLIIEQNNIDSKSSINETLSTYLLVDNNTDFNINLISILCLLFNNNSELFWKKLDSFFLNESFHDVIDVILLIAGISPHLNGSNFVDNMQLHPNIWEFLDPKCNEYFRQRIILALTFLSEGSDYFITNTKDGALFIKIISKLMQSDYTQCMPSFLKMARLSLICGGGVKNDLGTKSNFSKKENYMTKNYVVSIVDDHHILIRHGLGSTLFEVNEVYPKKENPLDIQLTAKPTVLQPPKDVYVSECQSSPDLLEAIEQMDPMFECNCDFENYIESDECKNISPAHSFLCDTGFLSSSTEKNIMRVPESTMNNTIENRLDSCEARPTIKIPIIQVDETSSLVSIETDGLHQLIEQDLTKAQTPICKFAFLSCLDNDIQTLLSTIETFGFCILFNETGYNINHSCKTIKSNVVLSIRPFSLRNIKNSHYYVDFYFNRYDQHGLQSSAMRVLFGTHMVKDTKFIIRKENLAKFVALAAILFYSANPSQSYNSGQIPVYKSKSNSEIQIQSCGPAFFVSGFEKRGEIITDEFTKKREHGMMPLLLEILHQS